MNELDASMADAQADLDRMTGVASRFVWKGKSYPAIISNIQDHMVLELAGDRQIAAFSVNVRKVVLTDGIPAQRDQFIIDDKTYTVLEPRTSADDPSIEYLMTADP
jgi:hypothetical protein